MGIMGLRFPTVALTGALVYASFVILAKFYGDVSGSAGRRML
jgi:hypothetical protein